MIRIATIFLVLFLYQSFSSAQTVRRFREHEVVDAGNGQKIEILKCRGEGESAECDVIFYTEKRQQGRRQWEKVNNILALEHNAKNAKSENKLPDNTLNSKPINQDKKIEIVKDTKTPVQKIVKEVPVKNIVDSVNIAKDKTRSTPEKDLKNNSTSANTYSLEQCFRLALEGNINLKKAQNNINLTIIDHKIAQYSLLPTVSYNLGHYFSFGKNIDPVTNTFVNENFSGGYTALGLQLQLFSGFSRLNTIKQSSYVIESAEYAGKKTELELLTNVTLTYARLLLNKELLLLQRNDMLSTAKQLEVINEKIKVGKLTRYESYAFDSRYYTEEAGLITIQNDSAAAIQDLKQLLNISYKQQIDIAPVDTIILASIYATKISTVDFLDTILQNHPAIKLAEFDEQVASLGLKIARANAYPSLSVGGNIATNYNVDQLNTGGQKIALDKQLNDNIGKNINISLHVPIFSQMENSNRIKKEKINISNAELNIIDAKNTIATNTLQLINDFNASKQKYISTLSAMQNSRLSFTMYEEKYKLGQISSLEILTAKDLLNAATSKYIQAKLELFFRYQLLLLLKK